MKQHWNIHLQMIKIIIINQSFFLTFLITFKQVSTKVFMQKSDKLLKTFKNLLLFQMIVKDTKNDHTKCFVTFFFSSSKHCCRSFIWHIEEKTDEIKNRHAVAFIAFFQSISSKWVSINVFDVQLWLVIMYFYKITNTFTHVKSYKSNNQSPRYGWKGSLSNVSK